METIQNLTQYNWSIVVLAIVAAMLAFKFLSDLFEWFVKKFGIETKSMREKRERKELLTRTAENLAKLQERHTEDEEEFRNNLNNYMKESRADRKALHEEMKQYSENRVNDRAVSVDREKRLNDRINNMVESDKHRDDTIDEISNSLIKLTEMFVDKQISDYRWEIINFATAISEKRPCTKDGFKHCFKTYEKYERILEENGLENGEVEISMEIVNEAYKEKLREGF